MSYNKLKVTELREECEKRGLDSSGTKPVLVARLEESDSSKPAVKKSGKRSKAEEEPEEEEPAKKGAAPKKKAAKEASAAPAPSKKKGKKKEEEKKEEPLDAKAAIAKKAKAATSSGGSHKIDSGCDLLGTVEGDWDAMLNQTNIGANNNKFYVIQLHSLANGSFRLWTRWGRVGEAGQNSGNKEVFSSLAAATAAFEKKFKDKTGNVWSARASFVSKPGKYTLIEMAGDEEEEAVVEKKVEKAEKAVAKAIVESKLPKKTQELLRLIFDHDMFKEQMANFNLDVQKMPLGKLSAGQVLKGYECLEKLEAAIEAGKAKDIEHFTSLFYTLIPHSFGRNKPPVISTVGEVQEKYAMLNVLGDIEVAQSAQKSKKSSADKHPLDEQYELLDADVVPLDPKSAEWKIIEEYTKNTSSSNHRKCTIQEIFTVHRHSEPKRFAAHSKIAHRKLLWHGTNVAVVVAILKTGLRIMPHSGGRVGKGIYFASENAKSAGYVGTTGDNVGIMFLNEVALGDEHHIVDNDPSLVQAPKGFHSVVAQGRTEPDPKGDKIIMLDGNKVVVPTGKPIPRKQYEQSRFSQSEYLVYQESQPRIRYLIKCKFS